LDNKIVPDIVLCSKLKRAIETGLYAYNGIVDEIYPVPFLSEKLDLTKKEDCENMPVSIEELEKYFSDSHQVNLFFLERMEQYLTKIKNICTYEINSSNFDYFIKYIVPFIIKLLIKKNNLSDTNRIFKIAIISHYHFMKEHFNNVIKLYKLNNNLFDNYNNTETWIEDVNIQYNNDNTEIIYTTDKLEKLYDIDNRIPVSDIINDPNTYLSCCTHHKLFKEKIEDK
jgi:hypothetical protein